MWDDSRRAERAATYGLAPEELDDHYRQRSLLKRSVYPEYIAEAVAFFAGERAAKSTGNMLNVDAGNAQSFPR
jgi:NAD(P)-dependent dehydrogenase (short-subunit alcohol dehydrogenase family)